MNYYLMNKNKPLIRFNIIEEFGEEIPQTIETLTEVPVWFPDLRNWLENRNAAKHRAFVRDLLVKMKANTITGFISLTNCLSLQDTLWVKPENSNLTWENINLFDNEFSEVMTHMAFDGTGLYGIRIRTTSPELTTDGTYDKCWVRRNGNIFLLKAGSTGARNAGLEPYCEYIASQFYTKFCNDSVLYDIGTYRNRVVSSCKSFSNENVGYKPISLWVKNDTSIKNILNIIEKYNFDENEFKRMIIADSVCVNSDRHFGNFGFLIDNKTLSPVSLAPIFDFNMAFSPYAEFDIDYPAYDEYLLKRGPVMGKDYISVAKSLLDSDMRSDLINLKDLKLVLPDWCFEKHKYQFTRKRLDYINEIKNVQIDRILGKSRSFSFTEDIRTTKTERSQNNDISETEMVQEEPDDTEGTGIEDPFLRSKFTWEE